MAQRAKACTGCHGPQGRSRPDGYIPRLAGKPAGYLHEQLTAFQPGRNLGAIVLRHGERYLDQIEIVRDPQERATGEERLQFFPGNRCGFAQQLGIKSACVVGHGTHQIRKGRNDTRAPIPIKRLNLPAVQTEETLLHCAGTVAGAFRDVRLLTALRPAGFKQ